MTHLDDARAGKFTAVFTRGPDALAFHERLTADPAGFYVVPGSLHLNRKGGRLVTWEAAPGAFEDHGRGGGAGIIQYWHDMADTVGHYGSSFGEPPTGAGSRTAHLNGIPCQAEM